MYSNLSKKANTREAILIVMIWTLICKITSSFGFTFVKTHWDICKHTTSSLA